MSPYVGGLFDSIRGFSASVVLAISFVIALTINVNVITRIEVNMKMAIKMMYVAAGTALLGRSGDIVSALQENAQAINKSTFDVWE